MNPVLITSCDVASWYLPTPNGQAVSGIVSIGDFRGGVPGGFYGHLAPKLRLEFDDVEVEQHKAGYAGATLKDVRALIRFGTGEPSPFAREGAPILVHCGAGISRSSACALVLLFLQLRSEKDAVTVLWESVRYTETMKLRAPGQAILPNRRVLMLADQELGSQLLQEVRNRHVYYREWAP